MRRSRSSLALCGLGLGLALPSGAFAQGKSYALESADGLKLHNVTAVAATLQGKKGLKLTLSGGASGSDVEPLALIDGLVFANGVIEAEIAGEPAPAAGAGARG